VKGLVNKALVLIAFLILLTVVVSSTVKYVAEKGITPQTILEDMTLEQKVGQLFILGFWGKEPDYYITKMITERNVGGIILLGYNIDDEDQLKKLTSDLQDMSSTPLFISIDQEGGEVSRIRFEDTYNISQFDIRDENGAFNLAKQRGQQLREFGINMNFSPVLDNVSNEDSFLYTRAFRGDADNIASLAIAMIEGYREGGIIACIKHFPGYSNESLDAHSALDTIEITKEDLGLYIYPFKEALKSTDAVMMGHILFPNIDANSPTSVSKYFVNDLLREELKFEGLIITDDMQMKSIYDMYSIKEAAVRAILVGNDILVYTGDPQEQAEAYNAVLEAVREGVIKEEEIDKKVLKILNLKYSL
jgi:beta-N-acetylhexosaminidase